MEVRPGFGALCPNCGIVSLNFSKCPRCNLKLPDNVKSIPQDIHQNPLSFPTQEYTGATALKRQLELPTDAGNDTPGSAALCHKCGWISFNFSKCRRCNYMFPRHYVQTISDHTGIVLKPQVMSAAEKSAGKTITRPLTSKEAPANDEVERKRSSATASMEPREPGEPEIVILSPDIKDEQKKKKRRIETQPTSNNMAPVTDPAIKEEPNSHVRNQPPGVEAGGMLKEALAGTDHYVLISCKTIRIGAFESKPLERVVLSPKGLDMEVLLPSGQNVTVYIPMSDISQVMFSLSHTMPVLFVSIYEDGGPKVRKALSMSDSNYKSFYFDPSSRDETLRRIILIPETLRQDFKMVLKRIGEVSHKCFVEIGIGPAYEMLVKSSPCEFENGLAAVCPECGWLSFNFTKCRRCNHILPANVKTVPSSRHLTPPLQSTIPTQNYTVAAEKRQLLRPAEKLAGKRTRSLPKPTPTDMKVESENSPCTEAPEFLILSSDDEDKPEKKPKIEMQPETNNNELPKLEISALVKRNSYVKNHSPGVEAGGMTHATDSVAYSHVLVLCKMLRIGTFESKPLGKVVFSHNDVQMKVPLPSGQSATLSISLSDISHAMFSLSFTTPALYLNLFESTGPKIRKALHMSDSNNKSFYFDPAARDESLRRIIFFPDKPTENFKMALKKLGEVGSVPTYEIKSPLLEEAEIFLLPCEDKKKPSIEMQPTSNDEVQVVHTPMGITYMPYPFVPIICRILQIGTFKVKPLERILFSTRGFDIKLPLPSGQNSTVFIPMSDISQFMVSFSYQLPVLIIRLHACCGPKVREALCMDDPNNKSFYFEPGAPEYALNRITILPEKLTEDSINSFKEIVEVNHKSLIEISDTLANEILFKSFKSVGMNGFVY